VTLTAGWHALEVIYVARTGYAIMKLEWDPAGGTNYADITAARLRSKALPAGWEGVAETCGVHTYYPDQELLDLDAPDCNIALVNGQYQPKSGLGSHPVVEVTWYGAKAYCRWLAECTGQPVDLPDEWLWEYAASGGDSTIAGNYYPWGPKFGGATHDKANYYGTGGIDIYNGTAPAGLFPTYFGLQDMAGNVWEWTSSPLSLGSSFRVVRGGSWNQPADPYMATSGRQVYKDENFGDKTIGFRPAVVYAAMPYRVTGYVPVAATPPMTSVNSSYPGYTAPTKACLIKGTEVTNAEFTEFLNWASAQGYITLSGSSVQGNHVDWHSGKLFYRLGADADIQYAFGTYIVKEGMEWLPAAFVTWYGANAWCQWQTAAHPDMRLRLPDEWEWENAMTRGDAAPERYAFYSANFEEGSGTEWSASRTDNIYPADMTAYSGKFNKETQTLTLTVIRGHYYTVQFDMYLIDAWRTSDRMQVDVNGWRYWDVAPLVDLAATETRNIGYNSDNDRVYRRQKITFYAATDTVTLAFHDSGDLQAASAQSWGLDNVYVYPDRRRLSTGEPAPDASNYLRTEQGLLPVGRMGLEVFYDWSFSPGIYDASGNVQEWTISPPATGMTGLAVLRGGAWNMHELHLPFSYRGDYAGKEESTAFIGFRPVIEEMAPCFERQQEDVVVAAGGAASRISLTARALNPGAAAWAWQLTGAPAWATLTDKTGGHAELTVTPPASPEASSVTVQVSDGILTSTMSFAIETVTGGLELREMPGTIILSQNCPQREFFIAARKVGSVSGSITWSVEGNPSWATIAALDSERAKLTVSATAAREADIVIRAQAGAGSATRTVHVSVRNEAPEILDAPQTVIMERNKDYVDVTVRGRDDDGCQTLSWSLVGSPAWVSIPWNAQSEVVVRIQRQGSVMNANVVLRLSDGIASVDRTINVQDANTAPELVIAPTTLTAALGDPVQNTLLTATDPDVEQTLTWSLSPSVYWLTVAATTPRSAVLTLSPTVAAAGQVFTLTMSDGVAQVQRTIAVTVANQAPQITGDTGSQDFEVGSGTHYLHYTVSDADVMQALTLRVTNVAGWFTWYPVGTRQIEVAVDTSQAVSGALELAAFDGTTSTTASVPVRVAKLVHAPVISGMPGNLTMQQYAQGQVYSLQATDANPADSITWGMLYRVPNVELIPGTGGQATLVINPVEQMNTVSVGIQASDGRTTTTEFFSLTVTGPSIEPFKIVAAEYFLDTEPAAGSGTPILSVDDRVFSDLNDYEATLRLSANLADGAHRLGIRFKRHDGTWGATRWTHFDSFTDSEEVADPEPVVTGGEFFIDTDPGVGLARSLPLDAAQFDTEVEEVSISLDSSSLLPGSHVVGLRMKRADGSWSSTQITTFYVFVDQTPKLPPATGVVSAEYYWDEKASPGFGFSLPLTVPAPAHADVHSVDSNQVLTSHIPPGTHFLGVRFQDAGGEWGSAIIARVTMEQETSPLTLKNLHIESNLGLAAMNYDSQHQSGSVIHLRVPYRYFDGSAWWSCQGWVGTGDVPSAGEGTEFTFTITRASDVTWLWVQDVEVTSTSDYGQVSGPAGLVWYPAYKMGYGTFTSGSELTLSVPATVAGGTGERFACTGFAGSGSVPAAGLADSVTFTAFAARNTAAWNWDHQYLLTVQTQGAGRVFGNFDWYSTGTEAVLTPMPNENSVFLRWEGALTGTHTPGRITMDSAKTVTAVFGAHRLWIVDPITGTRTLQGIYADGDTATASYPVPAHIATGSRFITTGWQGTGSAPATGTGSTATFVIHGDSEIRWTGVRQHFLGMRIRPAVLGSIGVTGTQTYAGAGWYDEGTLVIRSTPVVGAHFLRWEGDLRGAPSPIDVTFTGPAEITALFRRDKTASGFVPMIGGTLSSPNADVAGFTPDIASFDMKNKEVSVLEYVAYLNDALSYGAVTMAGNVVYGRPEVRGYAAGLYGTWTWTPSDGTGQQSVTGRTFGLALDAAALVDPTKVLPTFTTGSVTSISGSFTGQIYAPALGSTSFKNEGAGTLTLKVDGTTILNNAAAGTAASTIVAFGWHTAEVVWQATTTVSMNMSWRLPGQATYTAIDTTMLRHEATTATTSVELAGTWIGDDTLNDDTISAAITPATVTADPADGYNYVFAALPKDFTFQGAVPLVGNGEAGLMVRERNDENSPYFFAGLDAAGQILCRYRSQDGGDEQTLTTGYIAQPGQLFRMQRVGNRVQAAIYRGAAWLDLLTESTEEEWLEVGDGQVVAMMAGFHSAVSSVAFTGYDFWMPDIGNNFDGCRVMNLAAENCPVQWNETVFTAKTGQDNYPTTEVTWYGAKLYCKWLRETVQNSGYDLPSEWQVEYVAGNGNTTKAANLYPWPAGAASQEYANLAGLETAGAYDGLAPVGSLAPEDGIYNLGGNAWEWTDSLYWEDGVWRTIRGGSYLLPASYAATTYRSFYGYPFYGNKSVGFRPVCNQAPENVFVAIEGGQLVSPNSGVVSFESMIDGFKMQATEVTAKQYASFLNWMSANGHTTVQGQAVEGNGAEWADGSILLNLQDHPTVRYDGASFYALAGKGMQPVVLVSAYGADLYCKWMSLTNPAFTYRLPTEWEWEYAATYGKQLDLNWAAPSAAARITGFTGTHDVASAGPDTTFNAAGVAGLFDVLGNAAEWTLSEPAFDFTRRVVRGGAYDMPEWTQTAYYRGTYRTMEYTAPDIGFRVVSTPVDAVPPEIQVPSDTLLFMERDVMEDGDVVRGYVVRNGDTGAAVTVPMVSSSPDKLIVPPAVSMAPGIGVAEFECMRTDVVILGDLLVTITVGTGGANSATDTILLRGKRMLTVTARSQVRLYGDSNPALTVSYAGFVDGDSASDLAIQPAVACIATTDSSTGTYDITVSGGSDATYAFTYEKGILTVTPRTLTVTAVARSRIYGDANPAFSVTYSGFVNGDDAGDLDTLPTATCGATPASHASAYPIVPSGGTDNNYSYTYVNGTLTVNRAALTCTAQNKVRVYGDANPALTIGYTGLKNGQTAPAVPPSASCAATAASSVGTYPIPLAGGSDSNYALTLVAGTLTIGPAPLTCAVQNKVRVYGSANPLLTIAYTGLRNGQTVPATPPAAACPATPASPVGTYAITLNGGSDLNYTMTLVAGTLAVDPAPLTCRAVDKSRAYGDANPLLTIAYTGLKNGQTTPAVQPLASCAAVVGSPVGTYPITLAGGSDSNYALTLVTGSLAVTPRTLTVTAADRSRIYGDANPVFSLTYSGFVNGDDAGDLDTLPTATCVATPASAATAYPIVPAGGADGNYSFSYVNGTLSVSPAALSCRADDRNRLYGQANPAFTVIYTGMKNGDTAPDVPPIAACAATAASNIGTYPIHLTGGGDPNYTLSLDSGTLSVSPAALTITAKDRGKVYGETASFAGTEFTVAGLLNADAVTAVTLVSTGTGAMADVAGGPYAIIPSAALGIGLGNYTIGYVSGALTIGKATPTITWLPPTPIEYGTVMGVTQLNATANTAGTFAYDPPSGTVLNAGEGQPIRADFAPADAANWTAATRTVPIGVTPALLTITADDRTKVYGEMAVFVGTEFTAIGLLNADIVTAVTLASPGAAARATVAGSPYAITPSAAVGTGLRNYAISYVQGALSLSRAVLSVTANAASRAYGAANPVFSGAVVGVVAGDSITDTYASAATPASPAGVYGPATAEAVIPKLVDPGNRLSNYAVTASNGTLTVDTAVLVITANSRGKTYRETVTLAGTEFTALGLLNADIVTAVTLASPGAAAGATVAGSPYGITPSAAGGAGLENYAIAYRDGSLTVGKATPEIVWPKPAAIVYGTALGPVRLNATANTAGTFTYTPGVGAVLNAGPAQILHGDFAPADPGNWTNPTAQQAIDVTKAVLTVTALPQSRMYGEPNPEQFPVACEGFVNGDDPDDLDTPFLATCTATPCSPVDTYPIVPSDGADNNYAFSYVNGTLTVEPAPLVCIAIDKTKEYGEPLPACDIAYAGLVCGDTGTAVPPTCLHEATFESPVGKYPIAMEGGSDPNYELELRPGTLTIIDTETPFAVAIRRISPATAETNWAEVTFAVSFSEPVAGLTAATFVVDATGAQTAAAVLEAVPTGIDWKQVGAADVWSVRVQTAPGDGLLSLDLVNGLGAIQDRGGNALRESFTAGESYDVDRTPPTVASLTPTNGAVEVPLAPALVATFSEPVFVGTGDITILRATDGKVFETIPVTDGVWIAIAGNTVTISHGRLIAGSWYFVQMDAGCLVDAKGNPFAGIADPQAWRFRARQWVVTFLASSGGSLDGDTEQHVDEGASTTAVLAVPHYTYVFSDWRNDATVNPLMWTVNPLGLTEVHEDTIVTASFQAAATEHPVGEFEARIDAAGVAAGRGWWDLTGPYSTTTKGNPLSLVLVHDPNGRLTGTATYTVAKDTDVTMSIKGSVRGSRGSITMTGALKGANVTKLVSVSLALNLTVETANHRLVGRLTGSIKANGTTTPVDDPVVLDMPERMNGTWTLSFDLDQTGRAIAGTALLTLSNDVKHTFLVRGKAGANNTAILTLSGSPTHPASRAITIKTTITTLEGGWARLESFSGKGYGQVIGW
jgi:formylglycine-generating enzyme required for sulfatase activity